MPHRCDNCGSNGHTVLINWTGHLYDFCEPCRKAYGFTVVTARPYADAKGRY
jgi:hypothetical protein